MAKKIVFKKLNKTEQDSRKSEGSVAAPLKLDLLITVVNREKADFYADLIQNYEVNLQLILAASGTAESGMLSMLGLVDNEKSVILSIIKKSRTKDALSALDDKFRTVRNGKGIAYTVSLTSTIGVAIYQFLSNTDGGIK